MKHDCKFLLPFFLVTYFFNSGTTAEWISSSFLNKSCLSTISRKSGSVGTNLISQWNDVMSFWAFLETLKDTLQHSKSSSSHFDVFKLKLMRLQSSGIHLVLSTFSSMSWSHSVSMSLICLGIILFFHNSCNSLCLQIYVSFSTMCTSKYWVSKCVLWKARLVFDWYDLMIFKYLDVQIFLWKVLLYLFWILNSSK